MQVWSRVLGGLMLIAGFAGVVLAPLIGGTLFDTLWGLEPLAYIGILLMVAGLAVISLTYVVPQVSALRKPAEGSGEDPQQSWSEITQHYFELFDHDLGRPLRRILGKEREVRAILRSTEAVVDAPVKELLDEIERQGPNFRLMMSNIRVLVQLESPGPPEQPHPLEPSQLIRRIVDRYIPVAQEMEKEITWWSEPDEFGIVYSDSSAIEHIVTNLVDNAVRFASSQVEIKLSRNPSSFFVRVWDDGPGIAPQYARHIFDRGWTPSVARREEKSSSGLGLFIARTLARRYGGDLTVESVPEPEPEHHTEFLLSLPLK